MVDTLAIAYFLSNALCEISFLINVFNGSPHDHKQIIVFSDNESLYHTVYSTVTANEQDFKMYYIDQINFIREKLQIY